ncbi:MAG: DNA methyltransferase [Actinomycetota bacterium]|nr:DNA methyltransferase [Actinomycetota bacterium]
MTDFPTDPAAWDVATHRTRLAGKLPELRELPGAPLGDDADILAMSLPPYYTACPNPDLADWLAATTPEGHDDRKYVDPGPFTTDISEGKSNAFYKAHSYPTKVPHPAIMRFVTHYTEPGDVVLDGFCGTGMTGVAAQACSMPPNDLRRDIEQEMGDVKWGPRRAVLSDLSPAATFIAAGVNLPVDAKAFDRRSAEILEEFEADWGWMYKTTDDRGRERPIDYTVWSEVFTCPSCAGPVVFYEAAFDPLTGEVSNTFGCPSCGKELTKNQLKTRKSTIRTVAGDEHDRIELRPVSIHYRSGNQKKSKVLDDSDWDVLRRAASMSPAGPVPTAALPFMHMTHERAPMPTKGFESAHHFWGDRALLSLSALWSAAAKETDPLLHLALLFWVEQAMWGMSWQNRYRPDGYSQVSQFQSGIYYVPSLHSETNPRYNLEGSQPSRGKRNSLVKTWGASPARLGQTVISTASSTKLGLPDASIDYVFVDPPFGSNIYYADLAYLVESWHRVWTNTAEEAIVNQSRRVPRPLAEYGELMEQCFLEFNRVLKPGRWMTVEFSNSSNEVWLTIQHALAKAGFVVADTRIIDKEQLSYRQVTATNAVKRDLVISAYKPADELAERIGPAAGTPDTAWAFVREHLRHLPVTVERDPSGEQRVIRERLPDRLYDRMEAFHLTRNLAIPVTAAEFYEGLSRRFPQRDGMHFLDEQVETYERQRMTIKDLKAAQLFITDEESAIQWLRQFLKSRRNPQPYAAIQPEFFREVQAGLPDWEEAPDLKVLLERSCLQDDEGRWYVPDPKKEADLEKLRKRERLKEFATYAAGKGALKHFSLAAVRAGFSDAWERRDFASIVAVGKRLPAEAFAQDERLLFYLDNAEQLAG